MKFKFALVLIFGRANFGQIVTDVEVVEGQGEYEGCFMVMKQGESDQENSIVDSNENIEPNTVTGEEETEFMVGNDIDEMIQIFNKQSVDLYQEDLTERLNALKLNLNVRVDLDV